MTDTNLECIQARTIEIAIETECPFAAPFHMIAAMLEDPMGRAAFKSYGFSATNMSVALLNTRATLDALNNDPLKVKGVTINDGETERLVDRASERIENGADVYGALMAEITSNLMRCRVSRALLDRARMPSPDRDDDETPRLENFRKQVAGVRKAREGVRATPTPDTQRVAAPKRAASPTEKGPDAFIKSALVDLSAKAKSGEYASVVVDEETVTALMEAVTKSRAPNALLIGAAGCGKTTAVEALALCMQSLPKGHPLKGRPLLSIDAAELVAGTRYRGDFEERVAALLKAVKRKKAILFIDEVHTLAGTGTGNEGGMDAVNILKPSLAKGEFSLIGATTPAEAVRLSKDAAFMRRFEVIRTTAPRGKALLEVLGKGSEGILQHHSVKLSSEGVQTAIKLLEQHAPHLAMPAAGFELIDRAATRARLAGRKTIGRKDLTAIMEATTGAIVDRVDDSLSSAAKSKTLNRFFDEDQAERFTTSAQRASIGLGASRTRGVFGFLGDSDSAHAFPGILAKEMDISVLHVDLSSHQGPLALRRYYGSDTNEPDGAFAHALSQDRRMVIHISGFEAADPEVAERLLNDIQRGWMDTTGGRALSLRGVVIIFSAQPKEKTSIGFGVGARSEAAGMDSRLATILDATLNSSSEVTHRLLNEIRDMVDDLALRGIKFDIEKDLHSLIDGIDTRDFDGALPIIRKRLAELATR